MRLRDVLAQVLQRALRGADAVVHLAALKIPRYDGYLKTPLVEKQSVDEGYLDLTGTKKGCDHGQCGGDRRWSGQ